MVLFGLVMPVAWAGPAGNTPSVAFFYGAKPPWSELQAFDLVVVDPDHVPDPKLAVLPRTRLAAYVAVGEVQPSRDYATTIPASWLVGENKDWGSRLVDQSRPEWPKFFTESVVTPLWNKGYRTFFLDTLDSYHLFAKTPETRARQEAGMVAVIQAVTARHPDIKLIFNRGFEILPLTHQRVEMVVAESLFQGFDAGKGSYKLVPSKDREWLTAQLRRITKEYRLPVVVIDYVPPTERELARATAKRIKDVGFTPWVATPDLASLGVGSIEVMPRRVAVIHSVLKDEYALRQIAPVRYGAMPLQHLGFIPEYFDARHLPDFSLSGRYAAVLLWLDAVPSEAEQRVLLAWLEQQHAEQIPIAMLGPPTFLMEASFGKKLGFSFPPAHGGKQPVRVDLEDAMLSYERAVSTPVDDFYPLTIQLGRPLLKLSRGSDTQIAAALTPWGGYVLTSHSLVALPGDSGIRWVIDPFAFFKQALRLPDIPVPDVTTESGRRMLMVHMDGDGFISRSELLGNPMAGALVRDRIVKNYPIPMTISVIEAELSPQGLYPGLSSAAEKIAKDIYAAPHVAIASHSYSHPFIWRKASADDVNEGYNLRLPGYQFDLQREIEGSIRYIEQRLAPAGKKVSMFFWTGDCIPGSDALAWTHRMQVQNMNGGDTIATRSQPTVTQVEGLGVPRAGGYQVFAPNQNENVYTNNWQGPFYGFERVIETFEFTETPRRLKPINIYFHTYLTTKAAGMKSLDKVFTYALGQETTPVHVADYARKVLDFQNVAVARTATGWRVRGAKDLRSLRLPVNMGAPDLAQSQAVAGFTSHKGDVYAHLSDDSADLVLGGDATSAVRLVSANGRIEGFERVPGGYRWQLNAYVPLKFTLANAQACQVRVGGRLLTAERRAGGLSFFEISDHVARPLEAICRG